MKKALAYCYTIWCLVWFLVPFLILFPAIFMAIQNKNWHKYGHKVIRLWSYIFFYAIGMPVKKIFNYKPAKDKTYVFVANHFSYLDIAVGMNIIDNYFAYVGKSEVKKIPLFGYMFAKLHIQVDRADKNSRTKSLLRSINAIRAGRSIFIMPEGGIISTTIPQMHQPFKDGPFIMAIENQIEIIPISFLNLYQIQPDKLIYWGIPRVIFNEPISTKGLTTADIPSLKARVYEVIQPQLLKWEKTNPAKIGWSFHTKPLYRSK